MRVRVRNLEVRSDAHKIVARQNQIAPCKLNGIERIVRQRGELQSTKVLIDKADIELHVMTNKNGISRERQKGGERFFRFPPEPKDFPVRNPVDPHGLVANTMPGIYQGMERRDHGPGFNPLCGNFDDRVPFFGLNPRCFDVENDQGTMGGCHNGSSSFYLFGIGLQALWIDRGYLSRKPFLRSTRLPRTIQRRMAKGKSVAGRIPPHNLEAEQSLLGSLLIDKDAIVKVADIVRHDDFYRDVHGMIFEAMLEIFEHREPIDLVSLANRLAERGRLDAVGGRGYLAQLASAVPTAAHVAHYALIVQKKATLRRLIGVSSEIAELGYQETDEVDLLLDRAEQSVFAVSQKYLAQNFIPIQNILTDTFDRIDELHRESGKLRGLATGFGDLDNKLAGLQQSDLIILAARPSVGKTSLALDIARNVATKLKRPTGIFSLEMSKEQIVDRLLCAEAGVDLWKMRTGRLSDREEDDDFPRIGHAMGALAEAPIYIDDSPIANVMQIRTKARRLQAERGLDLLVVDYLQLMEGRGRSENRVQEISEITRALKSIARELNIPVIALSQLSRAVEAERPPIPRLAHLRESGSIEQDADVVLAIYRPAMYDRELADDRRTLAEIHILKHRNGPTGIINLRFNENTITFSSDAGNLVSSL